MYKFFAVIVLTASLTLRGLVSTESDKRGHLLLDTIWPDPDPEIRFVPHESSCHYFYDVESDEDITLHRCPHGTLFDYINHTCVQKTKAHCWNRHFKHMKHNSFPKSLSKDFDCPFPWGKFPDVHNCSMYFLCLKNEAKHKKCAPFEYFDKVQRKCIALIDATCADETDVVSAGYVCPKAWGSFAFPEDCSKYYECLQKKPNIRTCSKNHLFNEKKRRCVVIDHAHCGSRFNPYAKKIGHTTVESDSTQVENKVEIYIIDSYNITSKSTTHLQSNEEEEADRTTPSVPPLNTTKNV